MIIIAALVIVCFVIWFYVGQMNNTISENTIQSISEMAEHDKTAIQTYIEIYWQDLYEIKERFISDQCRTIEDLEERMALECDSANFTHICLVAEDGTVFTDDHFTYSPKDENDGPDFLAYFGDGKEKIVRRADHTQQDGWLTRDSIIYGVKLHDLEVDGVRMEAIIGTSSISAIQDNMVIDSFLKDGKSRGHSAIIDRNGNYIVNGMVGLEDLEEVIPVVFEKEEFETLNGFLIHELDRIPGEDEQCVVEYGGYRFTVLLVDNNTIQRVKIEKLV